MTDVEYIGPETGILQQTFPAQSEVHQHYGHCDNCDNCDIAGVGFREGAVAESGFNASPDLPAITRHCHFSLCARLLTA